MRVAIGGIKVARRQPFLKKRDFMAALTLLECDRKYAHNTKTRTLMGIAYCAFHNGDYR